MLPLPTKIETFAKRQGNYYVGLDCVNHKKADTNQMARLLLNKLLQITQYCKKYRKNVVIVCNAHKVPEYIVGVALTLRLQIMSVAKDELQDRLYGDFIVSKTPVEMLTKMCDVILVLKRKESEYEEGTNENDTPFVFLYFGLLNNREITQDNPNTVLRENEMRKAPPNNNPYGVFDLGEQGQRVFDNYYQRITQAPEPMDGLKPLKLEGS